MDKLQPDIVLVSPLERTLETCWNLFGGRDVPVIVEPVLAEAFRSSCDLSTELEGKIKRFPLYNFDQVKNEGDMWFINNDSQENQ